MNTPFTAAYFKDNEITVDDLPLERLTLEEAPTPMDIDSNPESPTTPMDTDFYEDDSPPTPKRQKTFHATPHRLPFTDKPDAFGIIQYRRNQRQNGQFYSHYQYRGDSAESPIVLP